VRVLLFSSILLQIILIGWRVALSWESDFHLNHVSGTWSALASDASHGMWYRPLYSAELGYGGTRYFPLHFALHGLLMRWGSVRATGHALDFSALVLLLAGVYVFLRRFAVPQAYSAALMLLVLATKSTQFAALTIRGDVLPAMLNMWGLVVCTDPDMPGWGIPTAAAFFTLAFAAKSTSVYGVAAVCLAWYYGGRRSSAAILLLSSGLGCLAVLGGMYAASQGRLFKVLGAVALEGVSPWKLGKAPASLLATVAASDPAALGFLLLALALLFTLPRESRWKVPSVYFVFAALAVGIIMATPGSTWNHLLDVHVAAICLIGSWLFREPQERAFNLGVAALAIAACIALFPTMQDLRHELSLPRTSKYDEALRDLGGLRRPILSEDPMLNVLAGERPYVLDAFSIWAMSQRDPGFTAPLKEKLKRQEFGAVVPVADPRTFEGKDWYLNQSFGEGFVETLDTNYEFAGVHGMIFYTPRKR
jgi:hypothetical protein